MQIELNTGAERLTLNGVIIYLEDLKRLFVNANPDIAYSISRNGSEVVIHSEQLPTNRFLATTCP